MGILYSRVKEVFSGTEFAADLVFFSLKATVMCFDQLHSRSVGKTRMLLASFCRFRGQSSGVHVYTCVFDGKWVEDPTKLTEKYLITSSHYPPWGWVRDEHCSVHHTGSPHNQWDCWGHLSPHLHVNTYATDYLYCLLRLQSRWEWISVLVLISVQGSKKRKAAEQKTIDKKGNLRK